MMFTSWKVLTALVLTGSMLSSSPSSAQEQGDEKPVFKLETLFVNPGNHQEIRLPKMVVANDGTLIAFAGLCRYYRTSTDQGETWSDIQNVSPECGGGNVVVDRITGEIIILDPGQDVVAWRSKDTAKTWKSEKVTFHPSQGDYGGTMGSEAGITMMHGKYKGRLILPTRFNPRVGSGKKNPAFHYNSVYYSDDRGKTWREGDPVQTGTGEAAVAELSDGSLYINSRSHMSCDNRRRIAWSYDGGAHFGDWSASDELFEPGGDRPINEHARKGSYGTSGGLCRMPDGSTQYDDVLLFSITDQRDRGKGLILNKLVVMASFDREETWPVERHIPHKGNPCYSSITADKDGTIYVLFEKNPRPGLISHVTFAKFNLAWLKEGDPADWNGDPPAGN